ncbi:MAG: hypothetical protein CK426_02480 [Legionella sp.]|nr:MAG: hypothetical protein CK423_03280 [Legionella sp.]PJD99663.1 MAG: hypothetical protein CK426_02480 [Legionella sp.]
MNSPSNQLGFAISIITLLVLSFMSNDLFIPSMPQLSMDFHVSANAIQNAITAWFFGSMSLQIVLGPISDQYGRKPILLFSACILIVASLICALSSSVTGFLAGRFLQGLGVSGIMVTAFAALHEVYEKQNNGTKILGMVGLCTALSPLAGPLIGAYVAIYFGWQANFYAILLLGLPLVLILAKYMPETITHTPEHIDWVKIRKDYSTLFTNWTFTNTVACYGMLFFAGGAFLAVVPFIFVDLLHWPIEYVGYGMMPMFICYMLASSLAGKLEQQVKANTLIGISLTLLSLLMALFIGGSSHYESNGVFILSALTAYYIGLGLIGPPLNNISLSQASSENKGCASALLTVTMMLGSALGASAISYFYDTHLFSIAAVIGGSIFVALAFFILYFLKATTADKLSPAITENE